MRYRRRHSRKHSYDEADRLTDTGVTYNNFGDIAKLPASDAGGVELQSTYYIDGQLDEQNKANRRSAISWTRRVAQNETIDTGTVNSTYQSHYTGPGSSPSWTVESVSGHWTRYVQGIGVLSRSRRHLRPGAAVTDLRAISLPVRRSAKQQLIYSRRASAQPSYGMRHDKQTRKVQSGRPRSGAGLITKGEEW